MALDKPSTGMGEKPDDKWAVPLCRKCHMEQHRYNELAWWDFHRKNPFKIAMQLYKIFGGTGGKPRVKRKTVKKRPPPDKRRKIPSRKFPKNPRK